MVPISFDSRNIARNKLLIRQILLTQKDIPSETEMQNEIGVPLAACILSTLTPVARKIMEMEGKTYSEHDSKKIQKNIPVKLTHNHVSYIGPKIEKKILNAKQNMIQVALMKQKKELKEEFCVDLKVTNKEQSLFYEEVQNAIFNQLHDFYEELKTKITDDNKEKRYKITEIIRTTFMSFVQLIAVLVVEKVRQRVKLVHERSLKQKLKEQQLIYEKLRDEFVAKNHARNQKLTKRLLTEFTESLAYQKHSNTCSHVINFLHIIAEERLNLSKRIQTMRKEKEFKLQNIIGLCQKIRDMPIESDTVCSNVKIWQHKCARLVDDMETMIEYLTNANPKQGRFYLNKLKLMTNLNSEDTHYRTSFCDCSYKSGGFNEYQNKKKLAKKSNGKTKCWDTKIQTICKPRFCDSKFEQFPFIIDNICEDTLEPVKTPSIPTLVITDSESSLSSIEYKKNKYLSLKRDNIDRKSHTSFKEKKEQLQQNKDNKSEKHVLRPSKARWVDEIDDEDNIHEDLPTDRLAKISNDFRNELLLAFDSSVISQHIGEALETQISDGDISFEILNNLRSAFDNSITEIISPALILNLTRKFDAALTESKTQRFRARDSVVLRQANLLKKHRSNEEKQVSIILNANGAGNTPLFSQIDDHFQTTNICAYINYINKEQTNSVTLSQDSQLYLQQRLTRYRKDNVKVTHQDHPVSITSSRSCISSKPSGLNTPSTADSQGILKANVVRKQEENLAKPLKKIKIDSLLNLIDKEINLDATLRQN